MVVPVSERARSRMMELSRVYSERNGDYRLQSSTWNRKSWAPHVAPEWEFPDSLTRRDVFDMVSAASSEDDAEKAFLAVMVWGFGLTGYGPHRVGEMKKSRPEGLGRYMLNIKNNAGPNTRDAYLFLLNNRATKLGPSYASKIAYFVTDDETSPILDALVARWIWRMESRWIFNSNKWSTDQYADFREYCQDLLDTAGEYVPEGHRTLGLIEYLMFVDQQSTVLPGWARTI